MDDCEQNELSDIVKELERRKDQSRYEFFVPNAKQKEFIEMVGRGDKYINLFVAANGVGKDCVVANILANIVFPRKHPQFNGLPLFQEWRWPKAIRIVTESQLVQEMGPIAKEIRTWWPKGEYESKNAGKQFVSQYRTKTGFYLDVMTYEQNPDEFEGVTLGCIIFSEPPPKDIFIRCVSRLREGGIILIVMTPLTNAAWIEDELVGAPGVGMVTADVEAACREHGTNGHLDHANIEKMLAMYDSEELEARAKGKFMHLANSIFGSSFKPDVHLIDNNWYPEGEIQWGISVDPAGSKPFAIVYWFVTPTGQIVIDDEWPHDDFTKIKDSKLTIKDYVFMWREWEQGKIVGWRIMDRHFGNARDYRGRCLMDELNDRPPQGYGMSWQNSPNMEEEISNGIIKVKSYLAINPITGLPGMVIKKRCSNTIRSLSRWCRDPETQKPDVKSVYKDFCDSVRYTAMTAPMIYNPLPFTQKRPGYAPGR